MIFLLFIPVIFTFSVVFILYHLIKFNNPYRCVMVFGKKGSGKSTLLCKLSFKYQKKGWTVYSNMVLPGVYYFDPRDLGKYSFNQNSCILIDEVGTLFDNRKFKDFQDYTRDWFVYQRQYRCRCYLFSQSFDVDKKIRDRCDLMYLCRAWFNCFTFARRIDKLITITDPNKSPTGESKIVDSLEFSPFITYPFGGCFFTYIPKWSKYFNSYDPPLLPDYEYTYYDPVEDVYKNVLLSYIFSSVKRCCGVGKDFLKRLCFHKKDDSEKTLQQ